MQEVGPLEVGETKSVHFDFSAEADSATTLSSPTVTCTVLDGTDPTPASVLSGSASVAGFEVIQKITSGVIGCTYKLSAFVSDSSGLRHHIACRFRAVSP